MLFLPSPAAHRRPAPAAALALCLAVIALPAQAADTILLQGAGVSVTTADLREELQRMSPATRAQFLADPDVLRNVADQVFLRRAFAARAVQHGLQQQPQVAYRLQALRDGVLADAEVARMLDAVQPDDASVEKLARSTYKAEAERFNRPGETRASHILIKGRDDAARARAQELLDQLKAGASFEKLAREHSADPGSATRGGSLGFFGKGKMVAPFEAAVDALTQPGQLSPIVETQFGLHIIRLDERRAAVAQSYEEVQEALKADIVTKMKAQVRDKQTQELRAQARGDETLLQSFIAEEKAKLPPASFGQNQ